MEKIAKVLIIDDDHQFTELCEEKLRPYAEVFSCGLNRFRKNSGLMFKNQNYTHVIIGGNESLIKIIRKKFSGPLIASSHDNKLNDAMLRAGCSHKIRKDKVLDSLLIIIEFEFQGMPAKKMTSEIKLEFVDLMLEFLNSVKNPKETEKTKELFAQITTMVKQRKNALAIVQMRGIGLLLTELELHPEDTASLLEIHNKMINIYTLSW